MASTCLFNLRKQHGQFEITQYNTHSWNRVTSKFIYSRVKSLVEADASIKIPVIIFAQVQDEYNLGTKLISYYKAWPAKQKAVESIFGNCKRTRVDVYACICWFLYVGQISAFELHLVIFSYFLFDNHLVMLLCIC